MYRTSANPHFPPHQIRTLESKISIERLHISYICLTYDLPIPSEQDLSEAEEEENYHPSFLDNTNEEETDQMEGYGLYMNDEAPPEDSDEEQPPEKSTKELAAEKIQEIDQIRTCIQELEKELSDCVEKEDFEKADTIQTQITELIQRQNDLQSWISQIL